MSVADEVPIYSTCGHLYRWDTYQFTSTKMIKSYREKKCCAVKIASRKCTAPSRSGIISFYTSNDFSSSCDLNVSDDVELTSSMSKIKLVMIVVYKSGKLQLQMTLGSCYFKQGMMCSLGVAYKQKRPEA